MARTISATALEAVLAQQTGEQFLTTVEIDHADLTDPLRFVQDTQAVTSNTKEYLPAAFEFQLPDDQEDNVPTGQVVLDNIDQQIIQAVRPLKTAPTITINILLRSSPDTVEMGPIAFELQEFGYDVQTIRGSLSYEEDFLNQAVPRYTFNPRLTPGLF